jgi:hypothetical protein
METSMTPLTPELREEIKRLLRLNPARHGEVSRAMEQGLDVDQMGTSRSNARNFKNSVEAMLAGAVPTTQSAAMTNSYGYRDMFHHDPSPAMRAHIATMLGRLESINPNVDTDTPLKIRTLPSAASKSQNRRASSEVKHV